MRILALATTVLSLSSPAFADDDFDDEDAAYAPAPRVSITVGVHTHGSRVHGESERGTGPTFEVALGRTRWQYLVEGGLATSNLDESDGRLVRGAVGARWIARQFSPGSGGGFELLLVSSLGLQRLSYVGATDITRPEVTLGVGVQARGYRRPRLVVRIDARAVFTPCTNDCRMETGSTAGFLSGMSIGW